MRLEPVPVLELTSRPTSTRHWFRSIVEHREVLVALAEKDFKVRYKRATFGVLWAVALPLLQALVMIIVFTQLRADRGADFDYAGYVLSGMVAWAYVAATLLSATTAIVEGAGLTDKVWFPRALLALAPVIANLVGLAISLGIVIVVQLIRGGLGTDLLMLAPATVLLVGLVTSLSLAGSALYVWFRDVRFIVQAGLLILFYATPILYEVSLLGRWAPLARANPFTGAINLFQRSVVGTPIDGAAVVVSVGTAVLAGVVAVELHRRNDRLFVDLL
jgi:ABC-type polysaccharide/polyol phosphate export permease